jgi:hypothetical protein
MRVMLSLFIAVLNFQAWAFDLNPNQEYIYIEPGTNHLVYEMSVMVRIVETVSPDSVKIRYRNGFNNLITKTVPKSSLSKTSGCNKCGVCVSDKAVLVEPYPSSNGVQVLGLGTVRGSIAGIAPNQEVIFSFVDGGGVHHYKSYPAYKFESITRGDKEIKLSECEIIKDDKKVNNSERGSVDKEGPGTAPSDDQSGQSTVAPQ